MMTYAAMTTIPITDLRNKQPEIIEGLKDSPIMLTRQGRGAGVLVHPATWNKMVAEIEKYKRLRRERLTMIRAEVKAGNYVTQEELEAGLRERGML